MRMHNIFFVVALVFATFFASFNYVQADSLTREEVLHFENQIELGKKVMDMLQDITDNLLIQQQYIIQVENGEIQFDENTVKEQIKLNQQMKRIVLRLMVINRNNRLGLDDIIGRTAQSLESMTYFFRNVAR